MLRHNYNQRFRRPAPIMSFQTRQIRLERAKSFVKQIKLTYIYVHVRVFEKFCDKKRVLYLNTEVQIKVPGTTDVQ